MGLLGGIWDGVQAATIAAINAVIVGLADAIGALISVLPDMPALPALPDAFVTAEAWVAWFFPVQTVVDVLAWGALVFIVWQGVSFALRWAKGVQ